ncbi:MAG: hypothetical protein AMXMBFR58_04110 [Phycisphaerae bacterium]
MTAAENARTSGALREDIVMPENRHRTPVSLALRRQNERAAARALLRSDLTESRAALATAAGRLWRHAERSLADDPSPRYIFFTQDLSADHEERTHLEETVGV